tara:strand:+ start:1577 stop:2113 length:537 start_codon:yes stop_codon:yes gene_type:complete
MKFFVLCLVLFVISLIIIVLKYNQLTEHFSDSFKSLESLEGAEFDPLVTLSTNLFKDSNGELINKGRIIKSYKVGNKYKFSASEVEMSYPDAVNDGEVSNSDMAIIIWRLVERMYANVSEQENNIKKLREKLKKNIKNLDEVEKKVKEKIKLKATVKVNSDNTINDLKDVARSGYLMN